MGVESLAPPKRFDPRTVNIHFYVVKVLEWPKSQSAVMTEIRCEFFITYEIPKIVGSKILRGQLEATHEADARRC
jgi:hypothetical protein